MKKEFYWKEYNMFADKKFYEVNREERHFGFLLIASVIYDDNFRRQFFDLVNSRVGQNSFLDCADFDIYGEAAIFRDYWNDLGKFLRDDTDKRREIIEIFLKHFGINKEVIDKYPMFWTGEIDKSKLWFPGRLGF